jgi:hypothetical protein
MISNFSLWYSFPSHSPAVARSFAPPAQFPESRIVGRNALSSALELTNRLCFFGAFILQLTIPSNIRIMHRLIDWSHNRIECAIICDGAYTAGRSLYSRRFRALFLIEQHNQLLDGPARVSFENRIYHVGAGEAAAPSDSNGAIPASLLVRPLPGPVARAKPPLLLHRLTMIVRLDE